MLAHNTFNTRTTLIMIDHSSACMLCVVSWIVREWPPGVVYLDNRYYTSVVPAVPRGIVSMLDGHLNEK